VPAARARYRRRCVVCAPPTIGHTVHSKNVSRNATQLPTALAATAVDTKRRNTVWARPRLHFYGCPPPPSRPFSGSGRTTTARPLTARNFRQ